VTFEYLQRIVVPYMQAHDDNISILNNNKEDLTEQEDEEIAVEDEMELLDIDEVELMILQKLENTMPSRL